MTSEREKKRIARSGAEALRQKPGWDPRQHTGTSPAEALRQLQQRDRQASAYHGAGDCAACAETRQQEGDESALCAAHLKAALGM